MNRSFIILAAISITAAVAAAVLVLYPGSYKAIISAVADQPQEPRKEPRRIKAKKPPKYHKPEAGDVDYDYLMAFRKCNAGDQVACRKVARSKYGEEGGSGNVPAPRESLLATDNTPAPVFAPTVFNALKVKTSIAFADKVFRCRKQACRDALARDTEKRRIYAKTLADAKVACSRRQIEGCSIQSEILAAGGEFVNARDALLRGIDVADSVVSRCEGGAEKDPKTCESGRTWAGALKKRDKELKERMHRVH